MSRHKPKKIFLVSGKGSYIKSGAQAILGDILSRYDVFHFNDFGINPKAEEIVKGIKELDKSRCELIIAVGGGSVIDTAKSINILAANKESHTGNLAEDILGYISGKKKITSKGKLLIAIPTTSGSGSEATKFAVIYIEKTKYSLEHEFMLPDHAIVDPQFTMSLPKAITASTGMDALCQAIESYWSVSSTDESRRYAKKAIKIALKNLEKAVNHPSEGSRDAMSKAAHLAGKAINISKTTACHAISYPITSYFNVPHGHAVALTLASMLIYNSQVAEDDLSDNRGVAYVRKVIDELAELIGTKNVEDAAKRMTELMEKIGLKTRLGELGIRNEDNIDIIIKNGFNPSRVKNNPRILTEESLRGILESLK
ncbi:phosphonoacetaldehyde reductase [Candidatus Woesearchaeota archaeon]|nr:phosphonoacetaldehyde reductase [Candidatus Woesearchaeota archaeon]